MITLEGSFIGIPPLINSSTGQEINNSENGIWISKHPHFSSRLKRYIVLLSKIDNKFRSCC
jgi:hypothetical protein